MMDGEPAKAVRVPAGAATRQLTFFASHFAQATVSRELVLYQQLVEPTVSWHKPAPVPMDPS